MHARLTILQQHVERWAKVRNLYECSPLEMLHAFGSSLF